MKKHIIYLSLLIAANLNAGELIPNPAITKPVEFKSKILATTLINALSKNITPTLEGSDGDYRETYNVNNGLRCSVHYQRHDRELVNKDFKCELLPEGGWIYTSKKHGWYMTTKTPFAQDLFMAMGDSHVEIERDTYNDLNSFTKILRIPPNNKNKGSLISCAQISKESNMTETVTTCNFLNEYSK